MADSELILFVQSDVAQDNMDRLIGGVRLLKKGMPVSEDACPKRIWGDEDSDTFDVLPDLFHSEGHYIVSERAANILRQFDLGGGALYPVTEGIYQKDNRTRIPGEYFCWIFGNVKKAFLEEHSPKAPALVNDERDWCGMPVLMQDDDIAVSASALSGPDIWIDPLLFKSIFLSHRAGQAMADAGLAKAFRLKKCRVI